MPTQTLSTAALYPYASISEEAKTKLQHVSQVAQRKTGKVELYSPKYYAACTVGGILACSLTHTAVTPLDLIKCRRQVDPALYRSNLQALRTIIAAEGAGSGLRSIRAIYTGWSPTLVGYSLQGGFKYGGYEFFKKFYSDIAGAGAGWYKKTAIYLAASASAEFVADVALCPLEGVKVRMQTVVPRGVGSAGKLGVGLQRVVVAEGIGGLYKGLYPLWGRQIPYTMMKFASFETTVEKIYGYLPKDKAQYGTAAQTAVSFAGGYIAGILCAIVSHPADVMVSKLNTARGVAEPFSVATKRIYSDIGFRGLWNGLPVRIVMIGTLTGLQWLLYDSFKLFVGLPTTGGLAVREERKGVSS